MRLAEWLHRQSRRRFLRNVAVIAGGTAAAQIITIAFSPVITRLYGPQAFGILGVFTAVAALVWPVASLAYSHAVVLPPSDNAARALVKLSAMLTVATTLATAVVIATAHAQIAHTLEFGAASLYLLLVPVLMLFSAVQQVLTQWLIRKRRFRAISGVGVAQAASIGVSTSAVGLVAATAPVLIVLNVTGQALGAALLWFTARPTLAEEASEPLAAAPGTERETLRVVARAYRDFPQFRAPQILLSSISQSLPTLMLAAFLGPIPAGFYALARRVLSFPAALISSSVGTVFLPRIAEASHEGERLRPLILKGTAGLALAGALPFGIVIAAGPWLFGLVFGSEWVEAGQYARWLALWLYFAFVDTPCVQAISLLGLQGHFLLFEVVSTIVRAGALVLGALVLRSDVAAIAIFSVCGAILDSSLMAWVLIKSDDLLREGVRRNSSITEQKGGEAG